MKKDNQRFDVDPILEKISPYIPDNEIDFLFPFSKSNTQGRLRAFKTRQLYRANILTMLKEVASFNKLEDNLARSTDSIFNDAIALIRWARI